MKMFLVYAALATATLTGPLAAAEFRAGDVQITTDILVSWACSHASRSSKIGFDIRCLIRARSSGGWPRISFSIA